MSGIGNENLVGKRVRVVKCTAMHHNSDDGCFCDFIGKVVKIEKVWRFTPGTIFYLIEESSVARLTDDDFVLVE